MKDLVRTASKLQLFVTCRAPGGVLSTCCRFVIPLLYGPTIKSKRQPLTTNYKEEAMRGQYQFLDSRFESMTQFWGWAALTWGWLPCWHSFFPTSLLYSMLATTIAICSPLLISASCHVVVVRRLDKQYCQYYWEVFQAQSWKARWGFKAANAGDLLI